MNIKTLYEQTKEVLDKNSFMELVIFVKANKTETVLFTGELTAPETTLFWECFTKIKAGVPLAYITKTKYFFENEFYVDERVLIPRFETELLVEEALQLDLNHKNVLDLCCGSGCIGISLKLKQPTINLFLADNSPKALEVCQINLDKHHVVGKIILKDYLEALKMVDKVDVLLINPPYIDQKDLDVDLTTVKYEPHEALFAPNAGLSYYEELFLQAEELFKNQDLVIIVEHGFKQVEEIKRLHKKYASAYQIVFKNDYFGNPRYFLMKGV